MNVEKVHDKNLQTTKALEFLTRRYCQILMNAKSVGIFFF